MRIVLAHALYLHVAKKRRGFCTSVLFIIVCVCSLKVHMQGLKPNYQVATTLVGSKQKHFGALTLYNYMKVTLETSISFLSECMCLLQRKNAKK